MSELNQKYSYRERLYQNYVSQKVRPTNPTYSEQDYQKWSNAAKIRIQGWLPKDLTIPILDMGCGPGNFLYLLQKLGYSDLTGVDLSSEQVTLAHKWCPKSDIIQGDVRDVLLKNPQRFGLISGFDIIEHLGKEEVLPFLELIMKALRPDGRLILQTPNAESPWMGSVVYGDFTHEWFYTSTSLSDMLRQVGFAQYESRESSPHIHGIRSLVRVILWNVYNIFLRLWNLAETGSSGSGIYTRVFIASAVKPRRS